MTNEERYIRPIDRNNAFIRWCNSNKIDGICKLKQEDPNKDCSLCHFEWLTLKAADVHPEPCPFCKSKTDVIRVNGQWQVSCTRCEYTTPWEVSFDKIVNDHDHVSISALK